MQSIGRRVCLCALFLAGATIAKAQDGPIPAFVSAAVASPLRSARDVARDPTQKPAEVLAFSGVKPGDRVADFWPVPPYSTALLSAAVGPKGRVYAVVPEILFRTEPRAEADVKRALAPYENVALLVQPFDRFAPAEQLDLVWLGKIYHDFPNPLEYPGLDIAAVNRALFRSLKPGGVLLVIDHAAPKGSKFQDVETDVPKRLHRIDPDLVKSQLLQAGFEFVSASDLLANAADPHDKGAFDPSIRDHTDRFVYKFRKPRAATKRN